MQAAADRAEECHLAACLAALPPLRVATCCGNRERTGAAFAGRVHSLAALLSDADAPFRVAPGDVVALAAATTDAFLEAWLAVTVAGAIAAPLNTRWRVRCTYL